MCFNNSQTFSILPPCLSIITCFSPTFYTNLPLPFTLSFTLLLHNHLCDRHRVFLVPSNRTKTTLLLFFLVMFFLVLRFSHSTLGAAAAAPFPSPPLAGTSISVILLVLPPCLPFCGRSFIHSLWPRSNKA